MTNETNNKSIANKIIKSWLTELSCIKSNALAETFNNNSKVGTTNGITKIDIKEVLLRAFATKPAINVNARDKPRPANKIAMINNPKSLTGLPAIKIKAPNEARYKLTSKIKL